MSESLSTAPAALGRALSEAHFHQQLAEEQHRDVDPVVSLRRRARSRAYRAWLPREAKSELSADASGVLARAAAARQAVHVAQVEELEAAVAWAALHPAPATPAAPGGESGVALAGEGAPLVAEFCVAELALRLGVSTDSGRLLLGDAVELAHRLPQTWSALRAGGVPAFRARRVAQATRSLPPAAAAYVDAEVAPYLHVLGVKALDAVIETALWRHDLPRAIEEARQALDRRGVSIDLESRTSAGGSPAVVEVSASLDRADAVELERAIAHLAHQLLLAGSSKAPDVRRSQALGLLARGKAPVALPDFAPHDPTEDSDDYADERTDASPAPARAHRRRVELYVHLSQAALGGLEGRIEGNSGPVSVDQVRAWCSAPGTTTHVSLRPVIDLNSAMSAASYEVPEAMAEHIRLRDRSCVFPHCGRDARSCDLDHIVPWDEGGLTTTDNIAALCRRHHRLKTHAAGWSYRMLHPGTYLWTTPHGQHVLRDPAGTDSL